MARFKALTRRAQMLIYLFIYGKQQPYLLAKNIAKCTGERIEAVRRAIYRNVEPLSRLWLIERDSNGVLQLTPLGVYIAWYLYSPYELYSGAPLAAKWIEHHEPAILRGLQLVGALTYLIGSLSEEGEARELRTYLDKLRNEEAITVQKGFLRISIKPHKMPTVEFVNDDYSVCMRIFRSLHEAREVYGKLHLFVTDDPIQFYREAEREGIIFMAGSSLGEFIASCRDRMHEISSCEEWPYATIIYDAVGIDIDPDYVFEELDANARARILEGKEDLPPAGYFALGVAWKIYELLVETAHSERILLDLYALIYEKFYNVLSPILKEYVKDDMLAEMSFTVEDVMERVLKFILKHDELRFEFENRNKDLLDALNEVLKKLVS